MIKKICAVLKKPSKLALYILSFKCIQMLFSDEKYLKIKYHLIMRNKLDLDNPKTFNEKLQWIKLYNRKPEYTTMVDKYAVREYVKEKIGDEYLIPLLGVWENPEDIDFDALPDNFVIKCNHNSGKGMYICKDKSKLNKKKVIADLKVGLKENYFLPGREWPYKNVKPLVVAEKFISDNNGELNDYKFFCFNGEPKFFKIDFDRFINHKANYYDLNMNCLPISEMVCPRDEKRSFEAPKNLDKMIEIVKKLCIGMPFVRIDLYNTDGKIYFGECTFFPDSGFGLIKPEEYNLLIGDMISLFN